MTALFAADVAPAIEPWVFPLIQGLFSLLLAVVGLYLTTVVKGLREDIKELRDQYAALAKDHNDADKRLVAVESICAERHGERQPARAGG